MEEEEDEDERLYLRSERKLCAELIVLVSGLVNEYPKRQMLTIDGALDLLIGTLLVCFVSSI